MKKNRLMQAAARNKYSLLAFGASAFVMVIVYYCFNVIPFGDYTVLRMDLYHQYGPLFAELYDRITEGKSLIYSWTSGLGSSFLGNFSNYLASPTAIFMLLLGHKNMPEAIALMVLFKAAFASAFFSYYLRKSTGKNDFSISAFGVLYSFCGFFLAYYWNVMWIDAMAVFPLVMYGIEQIIKNGKFRTYMFSLAFVMISNYYMAYIVCIFSVIYFLAFYLGRYSFTEKFTVTKYYSEEGKKIKAPKKTSALYNLNNSRFFSAGIRFAGASVAAAGIAAFLLIPLVFILQSSSATSGTFPEETKTYFKIFDFIANHLSSVNPTIRSSGEDVLPNVYCGVLAAMLAPLFLYSKSYTMREKISYVVLLALLFVSFNLNMLNYIWHGFHFPNDLPYRLSYVYSFVLLTMAYKALIKIKEFPPKMLLTVGISAMAFIVITEKLGSKNVTEDTVIISLIFVAFYTLVMLMMQSGKYQTSAIALLVFCCVVSEAAIGNTSHYVMQQQKHYYTDDYDEFKTLQAQLDEREDNGFYRMELTDLRTRMDPSWYGYNGISIFSSMAYEKTSNLVHYLGMDGNFINSYTYNGFQTPVFNMMASLKYVVDNTTTTPEQSEEFFVKVAESGKFTAYENQFNLPIGYCVGSEILGWDYSNSNPFTVQNDYFERATGIPEVFTQLPIDYFDYNNISDFTSGYDDGELTFFREAYDVDASFTANYTLTESAEYYIYINSSNVESVTMYYGDTEYEHNFGSEHIVSLGKIEAGSELSVNVPIDNGNSGYIDIYLCKLDMNKFTKGYEMLEAEQLEVETFEETLIKGTVTANSNSVFYTSIPYDESWQIYVDGERVSTEEMQECKIGEGFIGFYISEGTHDIELKYEARGFKAGVCISAVTIFALLVVFVIFRRKKAVSALLSGYSESCELKEYTVDFEGNISEKANEEATQASSEEAPEETPEETTEEIAEKEADETPSEETEE